MTEKNPSQKPVSSRQNLRKWLLIISFILLPVTLVYISPIIILMGAAEGIATGSMILFITIFFLSLVVARLWCGWLCPMGAWQEICSPAHEAHRAGRLAQLCQVRRNGALACPARVSRFHPLGESTRSIPSTIRRTASRSRPSRL